MGIEDVRQFYQDMRNNQATTTAVFVSITFIILLLMMFLLNRAYQPLKQMLQGIEFYRRGELDIRVKTSGLRELFTLGQTFNAMIEQIEKDITSLSVTPTATALPGWQPTLLRKAPA